MPCDSIDILRDAATRWYHQHLGEHLHRDRALAAQRCASHLINEWGANAIRARDLSLQVLGSVESRASGAYIDVDRTTSHMLFLIDPARNRRVALTATDLAHIALLIDRCGAIRHGPVESSPPAAAAN